MTLNTMKLRVAGDLTILADDGTTVKEGVVTEEGIEQRINEIYREELFPLFSSRFPEDFTQDSYPSSTYTVSAIVDAATTATNMAITTGDFNNSMVGFKIQDAVSLDTVKVTGYVSDTELIVDGDTTTWVGNTVYVLGNEYSFGGDAVDLKEIIQLRVKYKSTDTNFVVVEPRNKRDVIRYGNESFSEFSPIWYKTTIKVAGVPTPGFGILPFPTSYTGKYELSYTQRPPALSGTAEPSIDTAGISQCIINGCVAWGHTLMGRIDLADRYLGLYEKGKRDIIASYRPRNRAGASKVRWSSRINAMIRRHV
jgi:hypothetical protein